MPKATKKKKEKAADFQKAKLKLGKGKQQASNATDTSYKARSVALPTQQPLLRSLPEDGGSRTSNSSVPLSNRGLTLHEILPLLRHPNTGNRKDAIVELQSLLSAGGGGPSAAGEVLAAMGRMISDDESAVRKTTLSFLEWYLQRLGRAAIPPHAQLLLLQTSSALSHIFPEIRLDACRLIELLLDVVPDEVVGQWPFSAAMTGGSGVKGKEPASSGSSSLDNTILEGLRLAAGIGGRAGEGGHNGQQMLPSSKLVVLRALEGFVTAALRKQGLLDPIHAMASASTRENQAEQGQGRGAGGSRAMTTRFPVEIFHRFQPDQRRTRFPLESNLSVVKRGGGSNGDGNDDSELNLVDWQRLTDPWGAGTADGWLLGGGGVGAGLEGSGWSLADLGQAANRDRSIVEEAISSLYLALHPLLLSIVLEAAPAAFTHAAIDAFQTSASTDVNLRLCSVVLSLTATLGGRALTAEPLDLYEVARKVEVKKAVQVLVDKMGAYFPFNGGAGDEPGALAPSSPVVEQLCVAFASIVMLLAPAPGTLPPRTKSSNPQAHVKVMDEAFAQVQAATSRKDEQYMGKVASWLAEVLSTDRKDALQAPVSPQLFAMVMPTIVCLITRSSIKPTSSEDESLPEQVFASLIEFVCAASSGSALRRLGNELIMRLALINDEPRPVLPFYIPVEGPMRPRLLQWLESLPRVLWELNAKDPRHSELIIDFLQTLVMRESRLFTKHDIAKLEKRLVPFFHLQHQSKGSMPGPWVRLPSSVKKDALALVAARGTGADDELHVAARRAIECLAN